MEPRPQRPRAPLGQQPPDPNAQHTGAYREGVDPTAFIAPPRTEYDYSPLDLAPPGQRRRRQIVVAAAAVLGVALIGAIVFFAYLLFNDEEPPASGDSLLAAQTEIARRQATLAAEEAIVAQAAAEQTRQASGEPPEATTDPNATEESSAAGTATAPADASTTNTPEATDNAPAGTQASQPTSPASRSQYAGQPNLTSEQLVTLLPGADAAPAILTIATDSSLTLEQVTEAIGANRLAETNLATWGWSGNAQRQFTPGDPPNVDPAATSFLVVSIHGFGSVNACAEALMFFSDVLVTNDWEILDTPPIGDSARMLISTEEDGTTNVALYVQDGAVLYRFGGSSTAGDPTEDVLNAARVTLGA